MKKGTMSSLPCPFFFLHLKQSFLLKSQRASSHGAFVRGRKLIGLQPHNNLYHEFSPSFQTAAVLTYVSFPLLSFPLFSKTTASSQINTITVKCLSLSEVVDLKISSRKKGTKKKRKPSMEKNLTGITSILQLRRETSPHQASSIQHVLKSTSPRSLCDTAILRIFYKKREKARSYPPSLSSLCFFAWWLAAPNRNTGDM
jgi:hypothetical protein